MDETLRQGGLVWRVLGAWADLRGSMRDVLAARPSEGLLLFYAVLSGAVWFVGEVMMLRYSPESAVTTEADFLGRASALLGAALIVRTLALYGLAAVVHAIAKALNGGGGWRDSRAALFWAALVAAPAMVAASLLGLLAADDPRTSMVVADTLGSVVFAWVAAACIAEAHGFASVWRGAAVVVILAALVLTVVAVLTNL